MDRESLISVLGAAFGIVFWICFFVFPEETMGVVSNVYNIVVTILIVLGLILLYNKVSTKEFSITSNKKKYEGQNLMSYLKNRIEQAGKQNNLIKNDPLLSPMGFIGAMRNERETLKSQTNKIAQLFNVREDIVRASIDRAYNQVYNKYIE